MAKFTTAENGTFLLYFVNEIQIYMEIQSIVTVVTTLVLKFKEFDINIVSIVFCSAMIISLHLSVGFYFMISFMVQTFRPVLFQLWIVFNKRFKNRFFDDVMNHLGIFDRV